LNALSFLKFKGLILLVTGNNGIFVLISGVSGGYVSVQYLLSDHCFHSQITFHNTTSSRKHFTDSFILTKMTIIHTHPHTRECLTTSSLMVFTQRNFVADSLQEKCTFSTENGHFVFSSPFWET